MTDQQKVDIRYLIAYYDARGADWSLALEYEVRRFNGSLPAQEREPRKKSGGRPKKARRE
jgi:hypothetical protein